MGARVGRTLSPSVDVVVALDGALVYMAPEVGAAEIAWFPILGGDDGSVCGGLGAEPLPLGVVVVDLAAVEEGGVRLAGGHAGHVEGTPHCPAARQGGMDCLKFRVGTPGYLKVP